METRIFFYIQLLWFRYKLSLYQLPMDIFAYVRVRASAWVNEVVYACVRMWYWMNSFKQNEWTITGWVKMDNFLIFLKSVKIEVNADCILILILISASQQFNEMKSVFHKHAFFTSHVCCKHPTVRHKLIGFFFSFYQSVCTSEYTQISWRMEVKK